MVKRIIPFLILPLLLVPVAAATGVVYVASDPGDVPLYHALSERMDVTLSQKPEGDIILALDLNYNFLNESGRENLVMLLREAKSGKTVIIGFNTLRSLELEDPEAVRLLGISVTFRKTGIIRITPKNRFEFTPFNYDSDVYGIAEVNATGGNVLLKAENHTILLEIPVGKGRLVILTINPADYYLNTKNPAIVDFLVATVEHYTGGEFPTGIVVGLGVTGVMAAYVAFSSNPQAEKIRRWIKTLPLIFGRFITPPEDVLKNSTRAAIYNYIKAKGYSTIDDVASTFSISRTNARWHLSVLKRARLLEETPVGKVIIFHLPGQKNRRRAVRDFLLENTTRRKIYDLLQAGKSLSEIARILGVSKSTIHYNIQILKEYGVLGEEDEKE